MNIVEHSHITCYLAHRAGTRKGRFGVYYHEHFPTVDIGVNASWDASRKGKIVQARDDGSYIVKHAGLFFSCYPANDTWWCKMLESKRGSA